MAGHLKKTVGEILDTVDSAELTEWMAFSTLEPLDGDRADIHAAQVCAMMANQWRGKDSKLFEVVDFIPDWYSVAKPKKNEFAAFKAWMVAVGTPRG